MADFCAEETKYINNKISSNVTNAAVKVVTLIRNK